MVKHAITAIILIVGLINLYPVIGVISVERLASLYGIDLAHPDLIILMRHRAVLFGILGAFIIASAFKQSLRLVACITGLISMTAFVVLAYATGAYGEAIDKVVMVDIVGSLGLVIVLVLSRTTHGDAV